MKHTVIGVEVEDGKRLLARVAHRGELTAKDRAALEVAVQAMHVYLKNRAEPGGNVEVKLPGLDP